MMLTLLRTTLLMPWWVASLATGAKSFIDHPLIGSRRLNEAGLHVARVRAAHAMAERRRGKLAGLIRPEDRAAFERDGFVERRDFLPPAVFERLRDGLKAWRGPCREMQQGDAVPRRVALDPPGHPAPSRAVLPAVLRILADLRLEPLCVGISRPYPEDRASEWWRAALWRIPGRDRIGRRPRRSDADA
ncbi:hypothetical protein [Novosphingobium sp. KCTC 2891]|uniref:hypothetical protein n=1 Tax=Novosphingobium sp. KCTC 2891 TaxID=2989730 RepID=UPI002223896C|nr:hypothetical protein [Novosphingobium sp. KCTC 2891]